MVKKILLLLCLSLSCVSHAQELTIHVNSKGKVGFVDKNGTEVIKCQYDVAYPDSRAPITTLIIAEETSDNIVLQWSADEDYIDFYNIYVSENNGPFVLWLPNTTSTTATFKKKDGCTYRFLARARDRAGNMEKYDETKCVNVQ